MDVRLCGFFLYAPKHPVAGAGASGIGGISGGRERRAHGDAVKNITCLTNVPALKGAEKEEFDV